MDTSDVPRKNQPSVENINTTVWAYPCQGSVINIQADQC